MIHSVPTDDASRFATSQALGIATAHPPLHRPRGTRREPPPSIATVHYPRLVQLHTQPNRRARRAAQSPATVAPASTLEQRAAAAALRIQAFRQRTDPITLAAQRRIQAFLQHSDPITLDTPVES